VQNRCDRNRKRSKRRSILCPCHGCLLDSASQKFALFADSPEQLKSRGMRHLPASLLINSHTAVAILGEWLEAFWCEQCQETRWYHICKKGDRSYTVMIAREEIWKYATGVISPSGNPSVGEFTRRQSRLTTYQGVKDFNAIE
jgi:hypothetical protein